MSHSHLVLSICRGRTVPRRGPQIPSLVLVCGGKLGNTAEAETIWLWGRLRALLQYTCKGNTGGKTVKIRPGFRWAIGVWGLPQTCACPSPGGRDGGQIPWYGCEMSLPRRRCLWCPLGDARSSAALVRRCDPQPPVP